MKKHRLLISLLILLLCCACQTQGTESVGESSLKQERSAAPQSQVPTLRVLTDLAMGGSFSSRSLMEFLKTVPEYKSEYKLTFQSLPPAENAEAREGEVTRLRIDMMAGKGPDVLILRNFYDRTGVMPDIKNLFPVPQSAMKQNLFLPLDDYIANAQYMEWDKLLPKVMEAGKDGEGRQVLLPLVYSFRASLFEGESGMDQQAFPMTRGQMLESEDPYIKGIASDGWCVFADALCGLVDYETEELNFTQQELLDLAKRLKTAREQGAIDCPGLVESGIEFGVPYRQIGVKESPDYVLIPSYHQEGGVTAYISVYAAINRSTQHPDQCFAILDWLLSKESQRTAGWNDLGLPVHMDLGLHGESVRGWYLSDWNFAQFVSARDQIDKAVFRGPLYTEMLDLNDKVLRAESDAELEKLVHDSYARMRMILAES